MILTFNTAYFDEEKGLVRNRKKIAKNYLSFWFLPDLFWTLPLRPIIVFLQKDQQIYNTYIKVLDILICLQVFRLVRQWNLVTHTAGRLSFYKDKYQTWFYCIFALTLIHVATCMWIYIGKISLEYTSENWINELAEEKDASFGLYIESFYFMVMTVTTVGYGAYVITTYEVIAIMIIQIIGVVAYASLQGLLASHITNLDEEKAIQQQRFDILTEMSKELNMKRSLYKEIKRNIEFKFEEDQLTKNI